MPSSAGGIQVEDKLVEVPTREVTPVIIDSGVTYNTVDAGGEHTCGITTSNVLKCWGTNNNGELGDYTYAEKISPIVIHSGTSYKNISAATYGTCGITTSDDLYCWGNDGGLYPLLKDAGVKYKTISTGEERYCGTTLTGKTKCWGADTGTGNDYLYPKPEENF
jgi:alpha-tubulin suppressor-like RCC1 family protein